MAGSIYDWSLIPGDNATADGDINWQENQFPSTVNNSSRQEMTRHAEFLADIGGALTAAGTANAITVTANSAFTAYQTGLILAIKATATNTGAVTLNANALGSKAIRKVTRSGEVALAAGDITTPGIYVLRYDAAANAAAGAWIIQNPALPSFGALASKDTVATADIDDDAVTTAKLPDDAVTYAKMQDVSATDRLLGRSTAGAGNVEEIVCTAAGRALLDDADAAAQRVTLGLGDLATVSEVRSSATGNKIFTTSLIEGASAPVVITDAVTVNLDWDAFIYGQLTAAGNRTIAFPTNVQTGTVRYLWCAGNNATSRTLTLDTGYIGDNSSFNVTSGSGNRVLLIFFAFSASFVVVTKVTA